MAKNDVGRIAKGWGYEQILHSTDTFCVKELHFDKRGSRFSYHFHKRKYEEWTVLKGSFTLYHGHCEHTAPEEIKLEKGDWVAIPPYLIHRLVAGQAGSVMLEVSSADNSEDNYRVAPGDSQESK